MKRLRDLLADGLLLALPLGAAVYLFLKVIGTLSKLLVPVAHLVPEGHWFGVVAAEIAAVVVLLLALIVLGIFARSTLGRRFIETIENVVLGKVPGYLIVKSIAADFANITTNSELRPALVAFDDNTVLGFIVEESADAGMFTVFVPSAPGAAAGGVVLVPRERVQVLDVSTTGAMRAMKQRGLGLQEIARQEPPARNP
jgi:uncharacterized membrane protein